MSVDEEALRSWLEASCAAQGVPLKITDPVTIARVATLLRVPAVNDDAPRTITEFNEPA